MRGVLNVLAGVVIALTVIGGPALFFELRAAGIDWTLCFGIAVAGSLNGVIIAAILLAMAEGLGLMERVTGAVLMGMPEAVRLLKAIVPRQRDARASGITTGGRGSKPARAARPSMVRPSRTVSGVASRSRGQERGASEMLRRWTILVVAVCLVGTSVSGGYAIRDSDVRNSLMPRLDVGPPQGMLVVREGAPPTWQPTPSQVEKTIEKGRAMARAGKLIIEVLAPWRSVVDKGGEYATFLTPLAVACALGYQAEERSWPEAKLRQNVEEALTRFGGGACIYLELRSFAHESRAFGSAGEIRMGTPGEAYEATFLLDDGGQKYEGVTPKLQPERMGDVRINSAGHHYQVVPLPDVGGSGTLFDEHTTGRSYGANYYVWWPFVDDEGQPSFRPDVTNLRLTVITPTRKREYDLTACGVELRSSPSQPESRSSIPSTRTRNRRQGT